MVSLFILAFAVWLLSHLQKAVTAGRLKRINLPVMDWVHRHTSDMLTPVMLWASRLIGLKVAIPAVVTGLLILFWRGDWQEAAGVFGALLLPSILIPITKAYFRHPRPKVPWALAFEPSYSFPSGHAAFSLVIYGMAGYLLDQSVHMPDMLAGGAMAVAGLLAMLTGYSRVYLGVHYPGDILGGYALGIISMATGIGTIVLLRAFS